MERNSNYKVMLHLILLKISCCRIPDIKLRNSSGARPVTWYLKCSID